MVLKEEVFDSITDEIIEASYEQGKDIIIFNIGTDKVMVDVFGPLLGQLIKERDYKWIKSYGDLESPIHALNLEEHIDKVKKKHQYDYIIATDAMFIMKDKPEKVELLNQIMIKPGAILPGAGVGKKLKKIGDMKICYGVDFQDEDGYLLSRKSHSLGPIYKKCILVIQLLDELERKIEARWRNEDGIFSNIFKL